MALPTSDISMNTNRITNLSNGTLVGDAVNLGQLNTKANIIHTHLHTDVTDFDAGV